MSQATVSTTQQDAQAILPIMREYRDKLESWLRPLLMSDDHALSVHETGKVVLHPSTAWGGYLLDQIKTTVPLIEKMASVASGLLEHAELDFLTERELKLRLTELEVLFRHSQRVVSYKK